MHQNEIQIAGPRRYVFTASNHSIVGYAVEDLRAGLRSWRLAFALAKLDIRNRYRGSLLGPFWITLSMAAMLIGIGLLYARLLKLPVAEYLPWLAISLLSWNLITSLMTEGCSAFTSAEGVIRQMRLPYSVHATRCILRNLIVFSHHLPMVILAFVILGHHPGDAWYLALAGLGLIIINGWAASLLLGMACARFRDIPPIVASLLQLAFFLSPVLWKPEILDVSAELLLVNPFYALLEVVRSPLLGRDMAASVWLAALGWTFMHVLLAVTLFARFRNRIAFWV